MGYNEDMETLRARIDAIDDKLTLLFEDRMEAVSGVAEVKKRYGRDVLDSERESWVIERAVSLLRNKSYGDDIRRFYRSLMNISKKSQRSFIAHPAREEAFTENGLIGYLGMPGSFSHMAAEEAYPNGSLKSFDTFKAIFEGLKKGSIDYAVLPAENSETGSITPVIDMLAGYGFYIVGEKLLKVSHCLLGVKGSTLSDIKVVYSHPEPFGQCSSFLASHPGMETRPSLSTAQAAVAVSEAGDKNVGCIASEQASDIYGLCVLSENIQNSDNNCTRFVVVARQPSIGGRCNKTSIVFMVEHRPGSLCEILKLFSDGGVNILKLESRPIKDRPFEYMFHLDFEGSIADENVAKTIEEVRSASADFIYLGSYRREALA